ncbi:DUF1631 domain-containing protein [Aliikangiella marina]|uniref:DUF1631 domain-containing protein n=1 Tax=Aliikangiella marina TaxID=1712262 RepID=A0A545TIB0_9GAMM|nr:DUF1631 family protein [Aliikangiella marina]TQV76954.1 DUF1631 domain-containing protein [Aliikangiella marina]
MSKESVVADLQQNADTKAIVMDKKEFIHKLLFDQDEQTSASGIAGLFNEPQLDLLKSKAEYLNTAASLKTTAEYSLKSLMGVNENAIQFSQRALNYMDFIDTLFVTLVDKSSLTQDIKQLLNKLRIPILAVIAEQPKLLLNKENIVKQIINDLITVGQHWQRDDPRSAQLKQQIEQTCSQLLSAFLNLADFGNTVNATANQLNHFATNLIKRVEIFEKRVREAENGQAKAQAAKELTEQALQEILSKKGTPDFISLMLSKAWQHVIFLEFLKSGEEKKNQSLFIAKALLCSLQPIYTFEETEKFIELQPVLFESLRSGLEKSSYTFAETAAFLEELDNLHSQILDEVKTELEKGPKEEILRLKPVENPFNDAGELNQELTPEPHTDIESLTQNEWIEHVYGKLESQEFSKNIVDDSSGTRREKDKKASEKLFKLLQPGRWLNIKTNDESIRCKLAVHVEASDKYVFVNGAGTKVAEYSSEEMVTKYQNQQVELLKNAPLFERAFKSVLNELFENHIKTSSQNNDNTASQKQTLGSQPKVSKNKVSKNKVSKTKPQNKSHTDKEVEQKVTSSQQAEIHASSSETGFDTSQLAKMSVGSWVEIRVGYKMKKCRLAARIASTGKLIFTDRSGIKVKECLDSELVKLYESGDLKIDEEHTLFDKAFSSVISNMRDLKADKANR